MNRWVAVILAVALSACGFTMTTGPSPQRRPDVRPVCTESMDAPKRDSIGAVLGLAAILTGVLFVKYSDENAEVGAPLIIGGLVVTVGSYASGGIGYARVKKCRKAIAEFEARPRS